MAFFGLHVTSAASDEQVLQRFYTAESSSVFSTMTCDEVEAVSSSGSSLLLTLDSVGGGGDFAVVVVGLMVDGPMRREG